MSDTLSKSYAACAQVARRAASNFHLSFYLLPREKRLSMCALYAFLRKTDDLGDSNESDERRREALAQWRNELDSALNGTHHDPLMPALIDTVHRYKIPPRYLYDVMDGVEMDLQPLRFQSFTDLEAYCYHVASAVGLACIYVWGFGGEEAIRPAVQCGTAFQLTNILRDLKEDADRGRVYLPQEDLERFDYSADDLKAGLADDRFASLMRFEIDRTKRLYDEAIVLQDSLHVDGRRVFNAMVATYRSLLQKVENHTDEVLSRRLQLGRWTKISIAARCLLGQPGTRLSLSSEKSLAASQMRPS